MKMPEQGRDWADVHADLTHRGDHDAKWRDGKTAVYVFNAGDEIAAIQKEAYAAYMSENGLGPLAFNPREDLSFDFGPRLPGHANGMILSATDAQGDVTLQETYYSIGGGFVMSADELEAGRNTDPGAPVPYPFQNAVEMLDMCQTSGKTIADLKRDNEISRSGSDRLHTGVARIWQVMNDCIERGLATEGELPGGLQVRRRAKGIYAALMAERGANFAAPH